MSLWKLDEFLAPVLVGDKWPTLEEMQAYVGGYVQEVPCQCGREKAYLFCDEDGKQKGRRPNLAATAVLHARVQMHENARSFIDYATDDPLQCLPATLKDVVVGKCMVWVGKLPPEATE